MSSLLDRFQGFQGDATKQIGKKFCIPASLCNALRLCGVEGCNQERIRDVWYAEKGREIETDLDDQMEGADFRIFETLERRTELIKNIDNEYFTRPGDLDPLDLRKADSSLAFIERHIAQDHPVIVSTWNRIYTGDQIEIHGFHMWLILDFDMAENYAVVHDSKTDEICRTAISKYTPITLQGRHVQLDLGLRGCITHSDYSCLALWKESVK